MLRPVALSMCNCRCSRSETGTQYQFIFTFQHAAIWRCGQVCCAMSFRAEHQVMLQGSRAFVYMLYAWVSHFQGGWGSCHRGRVSHRAGSSANRGANSQMFLHEVFSSTNEHPWLGLDCGLSWGDRTHSTARPYGAVIYLLTLQLKAATRRCVSCTDKRLDKQLEKSVSFQLRACQPLKPDLQLMYFRYWPGTRWRKLQLQDLWDSVKKVCWQVLQRETWICFSDIHFERFCHCFWQLKSLWGNQASLTSPQFGIMQFTFGGGEKSSWTGSFLIQVWAYLTKILVQRLVMLFPFVKGKIKRFHTPSARFACGAQSRIGWHRNMHHLVLLVFFETTKLAVRLLQFSHEMETVELWSQCKSCFLSTSWFL